jgi:hypothetical protein
MQELRGRFEVCDECGAVYDGSEYVGGGTAECDCFEHGRADLADVVKSFCDEQRSVRRMLEQAPPEIQALVAARVAGRPEEEMRQLADAALIRLGADINAGVVTISVDALPIVLSAGEPA